MTHAILGSLVMTWLSMGSPAMDTSAEITSADQATRIIEAWPGEPVPRLDFIRDLVTQCGHPTLLVMPPRPGDPLQATLVSRLSEELSPLSFNVEDGERIQSDIERDADRTYAETSDAAAATRVLLARQGDYELVWRLEVDIDGPRDLYGVETWKATARLKATLVDLVVGRKLPTLEIDAQARQRTREAALDQSIEAAANQLAERASGPLLRNWYAASIGENVLIVESPGSQRRQELLAQRLENLPGVSTVERASPAEPPRLLVVGYLTAMDLVNQLGEGKAITRHHVFLSGRSLTWWWLLLPGGILLGLLAFSLVFRTSNSDPGQAQETAPPALKD